MEQNENIIMKESLVLQPFEILKKNKLLVLVLNLPVDNIINSLWSNAVLKLCCDGGANRLFTSIVEDANMKDVFPDFICGDLDSLKDSVKSHFVAKGTKVVCLADQDQTDFTKTVKFGIEHCLKNNLEYDAIVVYPAMGGRLDQMLANINTLYELKQWTKKPCYLLSNNDIAFLVDQGSTLVEVDVEYDGHSCGLVPIGCEANNVTTTGLRYNLNCQSMAFGSLISTSNSLTSDSVSIETSHPLLMVMNYNLPT